MNLLERYQGPDFPGVSYRPGAITTTPFGFDAKTFDQVRFHRGVDRAGGTHQVLVPFDCQGAIIERPSSADFRILTRTSLILPGHLQTARRSTLPRFPHLTQFKPVPKSVLREHLARALGSIPTLKSWLSAGVAPSLMPCSKQEELSLLCIGQLSRSPKVAGIDQGNTSQH
jgi:hypothetical protein